MLQYWLGQWDDALAELGSYDPDSYPYLRERWSAPLVHGVAALIAGRREQRTTAGEHLRQGLALPIESRADRENQDFLVAAHALALEQNGETGQALLRLAAILPRREGDMTLVHQWLPDLVRLALAAGDPRTAEAAAQACQAEAEAETPPARASAASLRCQGLLESDPGPLQDVVAHYRKVGPAVELPAALEDLAVVLAQRGYEEDARSALNEAVGLYEDLQARWDIRRAEGRLRPHGIKRGVRGRRAARAPSGWAALTSTEVKIAALVARGELHVGHRPRHVLVPEDRPDLHLPHPGQAGCEEPGRNRPRGGAPGRLALDSCSVEAGDRPGRSRQLRLQPSIVSRVNCARGKVSSV